MNAKPDRLIGNWLLVICAMMFGMVAGGGHARTIGAGFIIQDWRPMTGWIPPLTHAAWLHMFADHDARPVPGAVHADVHRS
jgi:cytochrome c oxidase assembly protein subunit 15